MKRNHRRPQGTARNAARREAIELARQAEAIRERARSNAPSASHLLAEERAWRNEELDPRLKMTMVRPSDAPFFA